MPTEIRPGEVLLPFDPDGRADATVAFIGRIRSPWGPEDHPRNLRAARERGRAARVELDPAYAAGLQGLEAGRAVILIYWMHDARRDLIVQAPRHTDGPRGTFALRSPVRPNPLALATVRITAMDEDGAGFDIDAIDCYDGTPLVDIKPWIETVDAAPPAADS